MCISVVSGLDAIGSEHQRTKILNFTGIKVSILSFLSPLADCNFCHRDDDDMLSYKDHNDYRLAINADAHTLPSYMGPGGQGGSASPCIQTLRLY
jgi:hypothetical protein